MPLCMKYAFEISLDFVLYSICSMLIESPTLILVAYTFTLHVCTLLHNSAFWGSAIFSSTGVCQDSVQHRRSFKLCLLRKLSTFKHMQSPNLRLFLGALCTDGLYRFL